MGKSAVPDHTADSTRLRAQTPGAVHRCTATAQVKAALHDADIDTDTDTNILARKDVGVGVDVSVVECGLNPTF